MRWRIPNKHSNYKADDIAYNEEDDSDMDNSFTIQEKKTEVPLGSWVRVKKGYYAGDLAQVIELLDNQEFVRVKLVPRLDLKVEPRMRGDRIPQKIFDPYKLGNLSIAALQKEGPYWKYKKDQFRDGYIEKTKHLDAFETENVNPTLEEANLFSGKDESSQVFTIKDNVVKFISNASFKWKVIIVTFILWTIISVLFYQLCIEWKELTRETLRALGDTTDILPLIAPS